MVVPAGDVGTFFRRQKGRLTTEVVNRLIASSNRLIN